MDQEKEAINNDGAEKSEVPRRRDGGRWPDLHDECASMLTASTIVYTIADIRELCRKGKVDGSDTEAFMNLPSDADEFIPALRKHKDLFAKLLGENMKDGEAEDGKYPYLDVLFSNLYVQLPPSQEEHLGPDERKGQVLLELHDEKHDELVYSVGVNHLRQWIQIVFRGSVTAKDFAVDADPLMEWFPNPVESIAGHPQEKIIGIHAGFAHYLHGKPRAFWTGKSQQIIESVLALQEQYPHYRTYVTGHSLGASLATLMAFELATTDKISKPVSCINFASPMVGNVGFRQAFQALEKLGHVRQARVCNYGDIIPVLPTRVCWCFDLLCCCLTICALFQSRRYWHVGICVLLRSDGSCQIDYQRAVLSYRQQLQSELSLRALVCRAFEQACLNRRCGTDANFLRNHSCKEYLRRLEGAREELKAKHLQLIYFRQARSSINLIDTTHGPPDLKGDNNTDSPANKGD